MTAPAGSRVGGNRTPEYVEAVACAVTVQRGMAERNAATPEDQRIVFRVGFNLGDIIVEDDDIFGDGVNIAARLEALAECDLADIFAVQDEIAEAVTIAIAPAIAHAEQQRAMRKPPGSLDAWTAYQGGLWHLARTASASFPVPSSRVSPAASLAPAHLESCGAGF
jgi:class 3 adenylate cyclase